MSGGEEQLDAALDGLLTTISNLEIGGWYPGWEAASSGAAECGEPSCPYLLPRR
jgi:hypothetical protein